MKRFLLLFAMAIPFSLSAQSSRWELSLTGTFMTPNDIAQIDYARAAFGGEVAWWYRCEGDAYWIQRRRNPGFGIRASYTCIPNGIAGDRIGIVGLVQAPLFKKLDYHLGAGLSSFTRSAFFTHDPENIFISTLVCCLIDVGFDFRIDDRLTTSFSFLHSSNGRLHRPNMGLNFLQASISYSLSPRPAAVSYAHLPAIGQEFSRHEVGFAIQGGAVASWDLLQEGLFPCYDVSLNYQYYLDPVVAVGGTLDFWYNGSHYSLSRMYGESYTFPCYISALGFVEGFWGPLSIKAGIGPALVAPPRVGIRFYERVGAYYNFSNNFVGIALNAHAGMIEFIELCYGHRFKLKR